MTSSIFDPVVFNWEFYLDFNADLRTAGLLTEEQAKSHWQNFGQSECRRASADFNVNDYLQLNSDLFAAFGSGNCPAAINHYLTTGRSENRSKVAPSTYGMQLGSPGSSSFGATAFGNERITFRTSSIYSGTVSEIWFRGVQYVNAHDTGRLFQTAFTFDGHGECFNPTEGGSSGDVGQGGLSGKSTSSIRSLTVGNGSLTMSTHPAYWYNPGTTQYCGNALGSGITSPDILQKTITLNYDGDPQMVRWQTAVTTAAAHTSMSLEALTGYHTGVFTSFYKYNVKTNTLISTQAAAIQLPPTPPIGNPTYIESPVFSTPDGKNALGVFVLDQEQRTPDGIARITSFYQYSALSADPNDSTTKWSAAYFYPSTAAQGTYSSEIILVFGDLQEVKARLQYLYAKFYNQMLTLIAFSPRGAQAYDAAYYSSANSDLQSAFQGNLDALAQHYFTSGIFEGRNGSASFNAKAVCGSPNTFQGLKTWLNPP